MISIFSLAEKYITPFCTILVCWYETAFLLENSAYCEGKD